MDDLILVFVVFSTLAIERLIRAVKRKDRGGINGSLFSLLVNVIIITGLILLGSVHYRFDKHFIVGIIMAVLFTLVLERLDKAVKKKDKGRIIKMGLLCFLLLLVLLFLILTATGVIPNIISR
jgi:predicted PurR-regulated permease PerM